MSRQQSKSHAICLNYDVRLPMLLVSLATLLGLLGHVSVQRHCGQGFFLSLPLAHGFSLPPKEIPSEGQVCTVLKAIYSQLTRQRGQGLGLRASAKVKAATAKVRRRKWAFVRSASVTY